MTKLVSRAIALLLVLFANVHVFAAKQGSLRLVSDAGDKLLNGRTVTVTPGVNTFFFDGFGSTAAPDYPSHLYLLTDTTPETQLADLGLDFTTANNAYIGVGNYPDASDIGFVNRTSNGILAGCGGETGSFNISAATYEKRPGGSFHILQLNMTFTIQCRDATGALHGTLVYSDTHENGDTAITPPTSGGAGGGGGTGGGGTDTGGGSTPPPTAASDLQIYTSDDYTQQPLAMLNGQSMSVPMHIYSLTGFSSDVSLTAWSDSPENNDFHVSMTPGTIASPGEGDATLKIDVGPMALPRDYIVTVAATTNETTPRTFFANYLITLNCDPPMILGIDQPQNQSVTRGSSATLTAKPTGSGPYTYQWYNGWPGSTWSPVGGATKNAFTTPAVNGESTYWVRISNACGSVDSNAVTVSPK